MLPGTHLLRGETGWWRAGSAQDVGPVQLECGGWGGGAGVGAGQTRSQTAGLSGLTASLCFSEGVTALIICKGCLASLQGVVREARVEGEAAAV